MRRGMFCMNKQEVAGMDTNWAIDFADNCNITSTCDIGTGDITVYGITGRLYINAHVTYTNLNNFSHAGMYIKMNTSSGYMEATG